MLEKLTKKLDLVRAHALYRQLRDVRSLGLVVFVVIVLLVSWSGVKAVQTNYKLEQQITGLQQQNDVQQLKNDNQRLKNQYYQTPQYLELAARQNFGLAMPGEKVLLVPKAVALAQVHGVATSADTASDATQSTADKQLFFIRNLQAWRNFFLNRHE